MMKSVAAMVVAAFFAFPAAAQDKEFDGPSVTVITGADYNSVGPNRDSGLLYGGQVGYDIQRGRLVIGGEAEITGSTNKSCDPATGTFSPAVTVFCVRMGRDLYAGGRIGAVLGTSTLVFGKVGYANARNHVDYSYGGPPL